MVKESGIAKSIGDQKEDDMEGGDHRLYDYLRTGAKVSKDEANYREQQNYKHKQGNSEQSCDKCKFNLPAEQICHIVEGALTMSTAYLDIMLQMVRGCSLAILCGIL